jgi:hypothetical protein
MTPATPKLVVSIDAEEDSWGEFRTAPHSVTNIRQLLRLQELFDRFSIKPTYLVTHPVATNPESLTILRDLSNSDRCEIGAHLHPWCTPPTAEPLDAHHSMLCNLAADAQQAKLARLTQTIETAFGIRPRSFRAGRWGIHLSVAPHLEALGYLVDSSVCPYVNWSAYCGPDFSSVMGKDAWDSISMPLQGKKHYQVAEIPPTIGFLQKNRSLANFLFRLARSSQLRRLRLVGLMSRLNLANRVWLSPELSSAKEMIALSALLLDSGYRVLNLTFHSLSLQPGLTPFVTTTAGQRKFVDRLSQVLEYILSRGACPATLTDTYRALFNASPDKSTDLAA